MCSNFLLIIASSSHVISIIFLLDVVPLEILIEPFGIPSVFSRTFMMALFALPFSGGAFTFILRVSFNQPATQSCDDEGRTFICSFTFFRFFLSRLFGLVDSSPVFLVASDFILCPACKFIFCHNTRTASVGSDDYSIN